MSAYACDCGQCDASGRPHYLQEAARLIAEREGDIWPWPSRRLNWGEIQRLYSEAGAPWSPDATTASHPDSLGWLVEPSQSEFIPWSHRLGRLIDVRPDGRYLFRGRQRVGHAADFGPEALVPTFRPVWERIP